MKQIHIALVTVFFCLIAFGAMAVNIESLDRVSVMMTRSDVFKILGSPDEVGELGFGLRTEIYWVKDHPPLVGAGCIYDENRILVGQAFIFSGAIMKEAAAQIKKFDFAVLEEKDGIFRLTGKDDDTGRPIVVTVSEIEGLTIVMTFEKQFYDRRVSR